jgi:hypothetical protein
MNSDLPHPLLANTVLVLHLAIVAFVVGGLVLIVAGNLRGWPWVNRPWFRLLHAAAIATVVAEAWFGLTCPLTTLEMWLRAQAGGPTYSGGFIEHWLHSLLYYDAPAWLFTVAYTAFAAVVAFTWIRFPPRRR